MTNLHDTIESNVHSLRSLGINYEHFRPLSVPFILEKLPNTIKLQISRKLERGNGKQKNFCLQLIRKLLQEKILKIKKKTVSITKKKAQCLLPVYCIP